MIGGIACYVWFQKSWWSNICCIRMAMIGHMLTWFTSMRSMGLITTTLSSHPPPPQKRDDETRRDEIQINWEILMKTQTRDFGYY